MSGSKEFPGLAHMLEHMERSMLASWVKISEGFDPWPLNCIVSSSLTQTQCLVISETLEFNLTNPY